MKKTIVFLCFIAYLIFIPSCSKKSEVLQGVITFISGTVKINSLNASVGCRVQNNDILTTSDNSLGVIQVSQTAVITLRSNSVLKFNKLLNSKKKSHVVSLFLNKGSTFHKVIKKGTIYSVKTPTVVASVRGTSFEVSIDEAKNRIKLLKGKVHVERLTEAACEDKTLNAKKVEKDKYIELTSGQSIEATADKTGKPVELNKAETDELAKLDAIAAVPDVENTIPRKDKLNKTDKKKNQSLKMPEIKVIPDSVKDSILNNEKEKKVDIKKPEVKTEQFTPNAAKVRTLIKKKDRTIEDIKVVFKRTDEIILYSGRVIKGAIAERGKEYSVITTGAVIKIPEKEIKTVRVIR